MKIRRIILSLRVKDLNLAMHDTNEYILILMYISTSKNDVKILYRIFREIYLISNLKTHLLIDNNVIDLEKIVLDIV